MRLVQQRRIAGVFARPRDLRRRQTIVQIDFGIGVEEVHVDAKTIERCRQARELVDIRCLDPACIGAAHVLVGRADVNRRIDQTERRAWRGNVARNDKVADQFVIQSHRNDPGVGQVFFHAEIEIVAVGRVQIGIAVRDRSVSAVLGRSKDHRLLHGLIETRTRNRGRIDCAHDQIGLEFVAQLQVGIEIGVAFARGIKIVAVRIGGGRVVITGVGRL